MIKHVRKFALAHARKAYYRLLERSLFRRSREQRQSRYFPLCHDTNYLFSPLSFPGDDQSYFTKFHRESSLNPFAVDFGRFTTEVIAARAVEPHRRHEIVLDRPAALPLAVESHDKTRQDGKFTVTITEQGRDIALKGLVGERFYYLPIRQPGRVCVRSDQRLVVGDPLPLTQAVPHRRKLVLTLFVDALTTAIFDVEPFDRLMPNLHRFFSKGAIFTNCFAASEWTLPSVPSIFSGRRTKRHGLYHPSHNPVIGQTYPVMSDRFKADDYLNFISIPGGRMAPSYGYPRGFHRSMYRLYMPLSDSLSTAYDHLRAFPERDHFAWVGIMEAHHSLFYLPDVSTMLGGALEDMDFSLRAEERNLNRTLNDAARQRYMGELRRIDFHLGQFLDFVQSRYDEEEILVSLVADHGVKFLEDSPHFFPQSVTRVPFMVRGGGVPAGQWDELVQTIDIAPTVLHFAGLDPLPDCDGRLPQCFGGPPARDYVLAESHYPHRPYHAMLRDRDWEFHLSSKALLDGEVNASLEDADVSLYALTRPGVDVARDNAEVVDLFMRRLREAS